MTTPKTARELVYSVMHDLEPQTQVNDDTELDSIGYDDAPSKDIIRSAIDHRHWRGVRLGFGALAGVSKISQITEAVSEAETA